MSDQKINDGKLVVEDNGTISVTTADYQDLVLSDNDMPNKKYVDDAVSAEDFWQKVGSDLLPQTTGDNVKIQNDNPTITLDGTVGNPGGTVSMILNGDITAGGGDSYIQFQDGGSPVANITADATTLNLGGAIGVGMSVTMPGDIAFTSSGGDISFDDQYLSAAINISESGTTGLVGYTATSIVGALNEVRGAVGGNIEAGTATGEMAYWDNSASEWKHTETTELYWDDTNKSLAVGKAGKFGSSVERAITVHASAGSSDAAVEIGGNKTADDLVISSITFHNEQSTDTGNGQRIAQISAYRDGDNDHGQIRILTHDSSTLTEALRITQDGKISTGAEAAPDISAGGLCLQQNATDGSIFTGKSTDVSHPFTDEDDADTYYTFSKQDSSEGGLRIKTYRATSERSLGIVTRAVTEDTTTTTGSDGAVYISPSLTNGGTGSTTYGNTGNLVVIANRTTSRYIFKGDGTAYADVNWTTFSDSRLKEDVIDCPYGLAEVLQMAPKKYTQYSGCFDELGEVSLEEGSGRTQLGLMAQDLDDIVPEACETPADDTTSFHAVTYYRLVPVLIKAIQELEARVAALES